MRSGAVAVLAMSFALAGTLSHAESKAPDRCNATSIQVNQSALWVDHRRLGRLTVVFESGGGNDSTVWAGFLEKLRPLQLGTFVYDRAGLGKSDVDPSPYSVQREVDTLATALSVCDVRGDLILVAHSYGGNIALLTAQQNRQVKGVVLLDTDVPGFNNPERVQKILDTYRPQYAEVRAKAPKLASAVIPMMEAYPATVRALDAVELPPGLPIMDIVAEKPADKTGEELAAWHAAHQAFVRQDKARTGVIAIGSGHKIVADRPDLVLQAIESLVKRMSSSPASRP